MTPWRVLPYRVHSALENMAIDEAVFREVQERRSPPTLRFYGWSRPSVSLGYFQDPDREVDLEACRRLGVDVVRRPTGGKAVLHGEDLTYAVIARQEEGPFSAGILPTYLAISRCLARALREWGIPVDYADRGRPGGGEAFAASCFAEPSRYELLVKARKICGSAQARARGAFLQHGSILIGFDAALTARVLRGSGDGGARTRLLAESVTCIRDHRSAGEETPVLLSRSLVEAFSAEWGICPETEGLTGAERERARRIGKGMVASGAFRGIPAAKGDR